MNENGPLGVIWCKNSIFGGPDPLGPLLQGVSGVLTPRYQLRQHTHGYIGNLAQKIVFRGSWPPRTPPSGGTGGSLPPDSILDNIHVVI